MLFSYLYALNLLIHNDQSQLKYNWISFRNTVITIHKFLPIESFLPSLVSSIGDPLE